MLQDTSTQLSHERSSRKEPMTDDEARTLLAQLATVKIARGKKIEEKPAAATVPDDLKGPTGNFRAPLIVKGRTLLVGFHEEALRQLL